MVQSPSAVPEVAAVPVIVPVVPYTMVVSLAPKLAVADNISLLSPPGVQSPSAVPEVAAVPVLIPEVPVVPRHNVARGNRAQCFQSTDVLTNIRSAVVAQRLSTRSSGVRRFPLPRR